MRQLKKKWDQEEKKGQEKKKKDQKFNAWVQLSDTLRSNDI